MAAFGAMNLLSQMKHEGGCDVWCFSPFDQYWGKIQPSETGTYNSFDKYANKNKKIKKDLFSCQHKPVKYDFVSMKMYLYARVM